MTNQPPILFVTSDLSRGIVSLARAVEKRGRNVAVASPNSKNIQYLIDVPHLHLPGFHIFGTQFMFHTWGFKDYIAKNSPIIHTLDIISDKLCAPYVPRPLRPNIGIDLKIYNPGSVSILRQTQFLNSYNIAPHQKLITVISPLGVCLDNLISAAAKMQRDDFIIALFGSAHRKYAQKLIKMVKESHAFGKIIFIGPESDLPSLLRASFAVLSLDRHSERLLKSAVAMARPTIWQNNGFGIAPNITLNDTGEHAITSAISTALDMPNAERDVIEKKNLAAAKAFSIEKTVDEFLNA